MRTLAMVVTLAACVLAGPGACLAASRASSGLSAAYWAFEAGPPTASSAATSLVDWAGSPVPLGIAFDQPLGDPDTGQALTLRFSPPSFASGSRAPTANPPRADENRRIGLAVTVGGPTPVDDSSHVARLRREGDHVAGALTLGLLSLGEFPGGASARDTGSVAGVRGRRKERDATADAEFRLSLALAEDHYATGIGLDFWAATLIAEIARPLNLSANLGFRPEEEVRESRNDELKMAIGTRCQPGRWFGRNWPEQAMAGVGMLVRNHHRADVLMMNTGLNLPLGSQFAVITSLSCSNRPERFDRRLVRGDVGLRFQP